MTYRHRTLALVLCGLLVAACGAADDGSIESAETTDSTLPDTIGTPTSDETTTLPDAASPYDGWNTVGCRAKPLGMDGEVDLSLVEVPNCDTVLGGGVLEVHRLDPDVIDTLVAGSDPGDSDDPTAAGCWLDSGERDPDECSLLGVAAFEIRPDGIDLSGTVATVKFDLTPYNNRDSPECRRIAKANQADVVCDGDSPPAEKEAVKPTLWRYVPPNGSVPASWIESKPGPARILEDAEVVVGMIDHFSIHVLVADLGAPDTEPPNTEPPNTEPPDTEPPNTEPIRPVRLVCSAMRGDLGQLVGIDPQAGSVSALTGFSDGFPEPIGISLAGELVVSETSFDSAGSLTMLSRRDASTGQVIDEFSVESAPHFVHADGRVRAVRFVGDGTQELVIIDLDERSETSVAQLGSDFAFFTTGYDAPTDSFVAIESVEGEQHIRVHGATTGDLRSDVPLESAEGVEEGGAAGNAGISGLSVTSSGVVVGVLFGAEASALVDIDTSTGSLVTNAVLPSSFYSGAMTVDGATYFVIESTDLFSTIRSFDLDTSTLGEPVRIDSSLTTCVDVGSE